MSGSKRLCLFSFLIIFSSLLIISPFVYADEVVSDGIIARDALRRDIKTLLYREKYEKLEIIASDFRKTKARFPDGLWKLRYFYKAFTSPTEESEEGWKHHLEKLNNWMKIYPSSITARIANGYGWLNYGMYARGSGYAHSVSERRWQLLKERADKAYELANIPPRKSSEDCPERYLLLLEIALAQNFDDTQYEELFNKAIAFEPGYFDYYGTKAMRLLPRWHGGTGDWLKFTEEAVRLTPKDEGMTIYSRLVSAFWTYQKFDSFENYGISWDKMKQGFLDMERNYSNSPSILNNFCRYACIAKDKETVRRLFNKIGDNWYAWFWTSKDFDKCRDMAGIQGKSWKEIHQGGHSLDNRLRIKLAQEGDPKSQWIVGLLYYQGQPGFNKNYTRAFEWFQKAADQGYPDAQSELGVMYSNGEGVFQDKKKAIQLYKLAAEQGDCLGAHSLGTAYEPWTKSFSGIAPDAIQAYAWYVQCNGDTTNWQEKMTPEELYQARQEAEVIRKRIASKPKIFEPATAGFGEGDLLITITP